MAGLDTVLGWLRGPQPTPSLGLEQAPPLAAYPNQADADYARNYGFADNSTHEDYLNNNKARVLGIKQSFKEPVKGGKDSVTRELVVPLSGAGASGKTLTTPTSGQEVNLNQRGDLQGDLRNVMMDAALAANRSPIAAMGFDPSRTTMDTVIKNPSVGGLYRRDNDMMYVPNAINDGIVHESTHRGLQKLREKYPDETGNLLAKLPNEEYVVRWLMNKKAGDPENTGFPEDMKERQLGIDNFDSPLWPNTAKQNRATLDALEELAIKDRLTRSRRSGPQ